jgi:hypothetical protein
MTAFQPLVAIITPVYNGSPWLERTMACVQRQTYPNIVHVLLDNASTDDTPRVIERFRGGRVPLKTARNSETLHVSKNWNAAVKMTPPEAKYILLLCADDLIRADAIEKMVIRAEQDPDILLVTAGDVSHDLHRMPLPPGGKEIVDGRGLLRSILKNEHAYYAWQLFFARWRPEDVGGDYFDVGAASIDINRLLRLMETGKVGYVLETLTYTRTHKAMLSAQYAATRNPVLRLWRWEAALKYAHQLFPAPEAARIMRNEQRYMLRFSLIFLLTGGRGSAEALNKHMRDAGYPPRLWDYFMAVFTWPLHRFQQTRLLLRANNGWPKPMNEDAFIASAASSMGGRDADSPAEGDSIAFSPAETWAR